jgi:glycine dehydrogenase subunit 1
VPYIPVSENQKKEMLEALGIASLEELFCEIPRDLRFPRLNLEEGLSEAEVLREISRLAESNVHGEHHLWFLGAGLYNHFIPATVENLASRGEFLSAYTPYQAEVSQGTLQAIFEYQSMIANLFCMDVVNAGHYDGATALAEAVTMALKQSPGTEQRVLIPAALHTEYKEVLALYTGVYNPRIEEYSGDPARAVTGGADAGSPGLACLVAVYPDFFGTIPNLAGAAAAVHAAGGLFIVHADPIMCGLFKSPGEWGADIVTAEGQCLGNDMNYGGPLLGIMAVTKELMRKIPGRIVGEAKDSQGRRGFVLTLSAREQHIRRERAVSNICSNQGLSMLRSCIYLSLLGKNGLRHVAELCWHRSHYAAQAIAALPGFSAAAEAGGPQGNFFREFTVKIPAGKITAEEAIEALCKKNIVPGLPLSRYFPERKNELLICVTENNSKADIDSLVKSLGELFK